MTRRRRSESPDWVVADERFRKLNGVPREPIQQSFAFTKPKAQPLNVVRWDDEMRPMCRRCKSRARVPNKTQCVSCLKYFQDRYDKRIGGADKLVKGKRKERLAIAA